MIGAPRRGRRAASWREMTAAFVDSGVTEVRRRALVSSSTKITRVLVSVAAVVAAEAFRCLKLLSYLVGVRGFEPPTPSSRTRCATRLRYTPIEMADSRFAPVYIGSRIAPQLVSSPSRPAALKRDKSEVGLVFRAAGRRFAPDLAPVCGI